MNITRAWTNERFLLPIDLTTWMAAYPVIQTARIVAQIRTMAASPVVKFAWDTVAPPDGFEGTATFIAGPTPKLRLYAPSTAIAKVFHPDGGEFVWEFGFFDPATPTDYIRIDGGTCHFEPGVFRG